ncbi:hypothetical protein NUW54_g7275 [Trametes sanguinea]|uniref:Uncharacterized protein n=1 Tax=Trametes sanguinea TaxID=158606 RepID=A0ACC1PPK8_9APHY|nr:hypothetical protein NUW54_g7275 [Trametes sanguinea]
MRVVRRPSPGDGGCPPILIQAPCRGWGGSGPTARFVHIFPDSPSWRAAQASVFYHAVTFCAQMNCLSICLWLVSVVLVAGVHAKETVEDAALIARQLVDGSSVRRPRPDHPDRGTMTVTPAAGLAPEAEPFALQEYYARHVPRSKRRHSFAEG